MASDGVTLGGEACAERAFRRAAIAAAAAMDHDNDRRVGDGFALGLLPGGIDAVAVDRCDGEEFQIGGVGGAEVVG